VDAAEAMTKSTVENIGPDRTRLNFAHAVKERFGFLAEQGFALAESMPTLVRYQKGDLEVHIYHGRKSYELGFRVGHGDQHYSMSELIRASDAAAADTYRNLTVTNPLALRTGLDRIAELSQRYGECALRDDPKFFARLAQQRISWSQDYALDVLAAQIRPMAEEAFQKGRYQEAADLYEKINTRLSPAERKKLVAARERS
jgi:hypothetical protein